jgi:hypothetical protein
MNSTASKVSAPPVYRPTATAQRMLAPAVFCPQLQVQAKLAPAVYRPSTPRSISPPVAVRSLDSHLIQMWPKNCTCHTKPHKSVCPASKQQLTKKNKETQAQHVQKSSFDNLNDYRSGWVNRNNITAERVREFCAQYEHKRIRGHASGDNTQAEQEVTKRDLKAYRSWHTEHYGPWNG